MAHKLHRQFGHLTAEELIKVLRNADVDSSALENEINDLSVKHNTCCIKFKNLFHVRLYVCLWQQNLMMQWY